MIMIMKATPNAKMDKAISRSWSINRHWSRLRPWPWSGVWSNIWFWSDSWSIDEVCSNSWRKSNND
jgi:hypothetical protein